jgi:heterodisulfide reductase subunit D
MSNTPLKVPLMSEMIAAGESPDILFWVGCSGSFDDRAKKITKAIVRILNHCDIKFAVLGMEESCTGDPAKRAGNEFLFQMQAMQNITTMNGYNIKKIVTGCPHCFNTIKNEYPSLGGKFEVIHHTQLVQELIDQGKLKVQGGKYQGKKIVFHDPCYLGRANDVYEAPREVIQKLDAELVEMKRSRAKGLCCGAGGAQMFKESEASYKPSEHGEKEVNNERTREALESSPDVIAVGCPFCNTMMTDGVKHFNAESKTKVLDVAELIANANDL